MTIDEMRKRKRELGYTNEMIAEKTGIPIGTVQKIFSGETVSPRYSTLMALEELFDPDDTMVAEDSLAWRIDDDREYTLDDYYALPDNIRAELIDGKLYYLSAPSVTHQRVLGEIFSQIFYFVKSNKGKCEVFFSPIDVHLDLDNKTMVQPDIVIICDPKKTEEGKRVEGAPDLAVEVLSPSTSRKDTTIKLRKYKNAGVKEYWIVDPEDKTVYVFDFTQDKISMSIFSFKDPIPVSLYDGKCVVDLSELA